MPVLDWSLLESATRTGLHHIRLRARIVYERSTPADEVRDLPEVVYAIYDPKADTRFDARFYVTSAKTVSARRLDATLPDVPFATWIHDLAVRYGGEKAREEEWRISYCDEFSIEAGRPPRSRDLCTVAYFHLTGGWGEIWLRTGRIELDCTSLVVAFRRPLGRAGGHCGDPDSRSNTGRHRRDPHHQPRARAQRVRRVTASAVRFTLPRILEASDQKYSPNPTVGPCAVSFRVTSRLSTVSVTFR